ncbi:MAG: hypothetical protein GWN62_15170 [Aliifodinibius sp.]|nr:hypothetical protein [Fodinibius sp.]
MTALNLTLTNNPYEQPYLPDQSCFDWCSLQHVVQANNISVNSITIVALAYIALIALPFIREHEKIKEYDYIIEGLARTLLLIFFFYYFTVVKWGVI